MKKTVFKLVSAVLALILVSSCALQGTREKEHNSGRYELVAGIIPENNPEPVDVNREDAWLPTLISCTKKMSGKEIDIEVKSFEIRAQLSLNLDLNRHIAVIRSYDQLKALHTQAVNQTNYDQSSYLTHYNEEYFDNNVLIVLCKDTGLDQYVIEKVTKSFGKLQIHLKQTIEASIDGAGSYHFFISIPKEEFQNVKSAVVFWEGYWQVY